MKTTLYIFNPYPSVGGADTTLHRFVNSINSKEFNIVYFSLKKKNFFSKKIKFIKLESHSTFLSFLQIKKIIENNISEKKIFFSMQYFVNVPAIIFLRSNCSL